MTTFEEFCQHYDLEADNPDSQEQYRQYREAGDLMRRIVGVDRHRCRQELQGAGTEGIVYTSIPNQARPCAGFLLPRSGRR